MGHKKKISRGQKRKANKMAKRFRQNNHSLGGRRRSDAPDLFTKIDEYKLSGVRFVNPEGGYKASVSGIDREIAKQIVSKVKPYAFNSEKVETPIHLLVNYLVGEVEDKTYIQIDKGRVSLPRLSNGNYGFTDNEGEVLDYHDGSVFG